MGRNRGEKEPELDRNRGFRRLWGLPPAVFHVDTVQAPLGDADAIARLLATIPIPGTVRALLHKPFFGRRWDRHEQRDFWLASDGATVVCLTISGASATTVARVRSRFDDLRMKTPGLSPSSKMLRSLLAAVTREESTAS